MSKLRFMTDREIVRLYREWSEDTWRTSFQAHNETTVRDFREWLALMPEEQVFESYELDMLAEYRKQEIVA